MKYPPTTPDPARLELVANLRRQVEKLEGVQRPSDETSISSGCPALDARLPRRGFSRGTLVEWLAPNDACGAATLALLAAREACRTGGALVVLDRQRRFYPPAAVAWGIELEQLIIVQAATEADELWAFDQALRCPAVAAVWAPCGEIDWRDFRRLQLAAETGGALGLLLRPAALRGQPTWSDVQLLIEPLPAGEKDAGVRLRLEITRCRGSTGGQVIELVIEESGEVREPSYRSLASASHETHPVHSTPPLAPPAPPRRRAGA